MAGRARSLCTSAQLTGKSLQHNTDEYMTLTSGICCTIVDGFRYPMCSDCRCTMHCMSVHMCLISYIRVCLTLAVHLCVCVCVCVICYSVDAPSLPSFLFRCHATTPERPTPCLPHAVHQCTIAGCSFAIASKSIVPRATHHQRNRWGTTSTDPCT